MRQSSESGSPDINCSRIKIIFAQLFLRVNLVLVFAHFGHILRKSAKISKRNVKLVI